MQRVKDEPAASRLETMIRQQVIERGITDGRVVGALRAVPREPFFPADAVTEAYADRPNPIGHGQTISQPYIVALMTDRLNIGPADRVLEIGTGSGYQTAVLSKLAGEVWSVERVKPLLDGAWERLMAMGVRNVHFRHGDGTVGWADAAPFDRIVVTAGAPRMPDSLLDQLKVGGVAVLPVGPLDRQVLMEVRRTDRGFDNTEICGCRFVKLVGEGGWAD